MDITKRFRKDLTYYLLAVIIPGLINALTIPLLKKFLGASNFGIYGIRYNFLLLINVFCVGWLYQSIIRLKATAKEDEEGFFKLILLLGAKFLIPVAIVCYVVNIWYYHNGLFFSFLFSSGIILCGYQTVLMGISQANFFSRFTMYSEAVRTAIFFLAAVLFLHIKILSFIEALFLALNISYLTSNAMMIYKNKPDKNNRGAIKEKYNPAVHSDAIFKYGIPLAFWFLIVQIIMFIDKPLLAQSMGYEVQGNYQALYELISKGALVLLVPVPYALGPLLSNAFENNDEATGIRLLKKVVLIELGILVLALITYWWFGFFLLQYMLSIPEGIDYKLSGFFMLAGAILWQVAFLIQKPFELRKQTATLVWIVLGALAIFSLVMFIVIKNPEMGIFRFTLPLFCSGIGYMFICMYALGLHKKIKSQVKYWRGIVNNKD